MSTFQNIDEARAYFEGDRFAVENGMVIEAMGDNWATCAFEITPSHRNAFGGVMGGAIFTLADYASAVASNNAHRPTVMQQVSGNFLSVTRGRRLTATARCVKDGRSTCVYNIEVTDDLGVLIAQFVDTGYKLPG